MDRRRILDKLMYTALLGVSSVALLQFVQLPKLSTALTVSLFAFAVAIPLLSMGLFTVAFLEVYESRTPPLWFGALEAVGIIVALLGLAALLWHLHWLASIVFCATSLVAIVAWSYYAFTIGFGKDPDKWT